MGRRRFRDSGAKLTVEYLTSFQSGDLAFTTAIERAEVKVAGQEKAAPMALRVTHIFRKEDGAWKMILRHADPLVAKTAAISCWKSDRRPVAVPVAALMARLWARSGPRLLHLQLQRHSQGSQGPTKGADDKSAVGTVMPRYPQRQLRWRSSCRRVNWRDGFCILK